MGELIQVVKDFQGLGVAGVLALVGWLIARYFLAEVERLHKLHAEMVAELRTCQESRYADQVLWAEKYREASVRDETAAQVLAKRMEEQAAAFVKLADRIR